MLSNLQNILEKGLTLPLRHSLYLDYDGLHSKKISITGWSQCPDAALLR